MNEHEDDIFRTKRISKGLRSKDPREQKSLSIHYYSSLEQFFSLPRKDWRIPFTEITGVR